MDITLIKPDGTTGQSTARDAQLLSKAQALIEQDPHFQALKSPVLSRAEANAGEQDTEAGYLYLRYDVPGSTPQEFWAHWGSHDHLAWKSGQVTVKNS